MIQRTLLVILMVLGPLGLTWAEDWPQWGGADRTNVSKETGLLPAWPAGGPKLLWTFRDAGFGYASMSIVGNRLYSMGAENDRVKEYVYAIDLNTRKKLWSEEVDACRESANHYGPCSTPTIDGHFLYAISHWGNLVCLDAASGKKIWSHMLNVRKDKPLEGRTYVYCQSPLVDGDQLIALSGDNDKGEIVALDKKTGKRKWRCPISKNDDTYSSLIVIEPNGVRQYVQANKRSVVGVQSTDGKLLWRFPGDTGDGATPIYRDHCVYVATFRRSLLFKLLPEQDHFKAKLIYNREGMANDWFGTVLVGESIYGYFWDQGWVCQDFKTGKTMWKKTPSGRLGRASVTYADGNLYYYHENRGDVLLLKATPAGYQEQGRFRIPEASKLRHKDGCMWTRPVVANGRLYLRDQDLIFCYDVCKPQ